MRTFRALPLTEKGVLLLFALSGAVFGLGCSEKMRDRIVVDLREGQEEPFVPLSALPLKTAQDFDTLDRWLSQGNFSEDTQKVYGNLLRLFPDDPTVAGHAAVALLACNHERAREFGKVVLDRFMERIDETPVLKRLREALSTGVFAPEMESKD